MAMLLKGISFASATPVDPCSGFKSCCSDCAENEPDNKLGCQINCYSDKNSDGTCGSCQS
jgi:hypothetical protein